MDQQLNDVATSLTHADGTGGVINGQIFGHQQREICKGSAMLAGSTLRAHSIHR